MSALEWLRERQEQSERNRRLFENRPNTLRAGEVATHSMIPASQAWSGYKPGGGLMVRQPEVKNKLVQKRGDLTMTKEWVDNARFQKEDPDQSNIKISAVPRDRSPGKEWMMPPPRNQRNPFDIPQHMFPQGLSPEAQAAIAQVQATGGQNVDAYGDPIGIGENTNQAGGWARTAGMWDVPAKAQSPSLTDRYTNWWDTVVRPNTGGRMSEGVQDFMRENPYFTPMIKNYGLRGIRALADKIGLGGGQSEMAPRVTDFQTNVVDRRPPTVPYDTTADRIWGSRFVPNPGRGGQPGVQEENLYRDPPPKTLFSMGIPLPDYDKWSEAQKRDEMLQEMIRRRLDPSTLRQSYQRSGGRY